MLFDYTYGNYKKRDMGNFETSYTILYIIHVIISTIFLLNYFVSILQMVYNLMGSDGDFYSVQY